MRNQNSTATADSRSVLWPDSVLKPDLRLRFHGNDIRHLNINKALAWKMSRHSCGKCGEDLSGVLGAFAEGVERFHCFGGAGFYGLFEDKERLDADGQKIFR